MAVTESADGTRSTTIVDSSLVTWTIQSGVMLRGGVDTGGRGTIYLYQNHSVYAFGTDNNWWLYVAVGNWRYVGADPGGQTTASAESAEGTRGSTVVDSSLATWTIQSRVMLRNGVDSGGRGTIYLYHNHKVYAFGTDNNWWLYVSAGSWQYVGADPAPASTGTESADGTRGNSVVDASLATWTIQGTVLLRAGVDTTGRGTTYLYHNHAVYALGTDNNWWMYDSSTRAWKYVGADPAQQQQSATESAEGTRGTTVVDSSLATWTIQGTILLRAGIDTTGRGSIYLYHNHNVYALGTDNSWYLYDSTTHTWKNVGADPTLAKNLASQTAVNLAPLGFWGNCDPFINRFKRSTRWWNSGGVTKDQYTDQRTEWLHGIASGDNLTVLICVRDIGGEMDFTEQRSGTHYLLWQGNLTLSVTGTGVANGRLVSPGRYAFDIPPTINVNGVPTLANPEISVQVVNQTQVPQDLVATVVNGVQYPAIIHADDEADFLAGKHYQRNFINSLSNAKAVRTMDWNMCPNGGIAPNGAVTVDTIEPVNYYDQTCRTYITSDDNRYFFPPEEIGNLAREGNVSVFNSINAKSSDATFDYWGSKFATAAGAGWSGQLLSELGDENWNTAWPWSVGNRYLIDRISPSLKVVDQHGNPSTSDVDKMGCATAARSLTLWNIMERYIPRSRHKRVLGGQFAGGIDRSGMGGMFAYVDPVTGQQAHELADYYAVAPYWTADRSDGLTLATILSNSMWLAGDQYWIDRCKLNIDRMQLWLGYNKQVLATYAPNLKLTCYEGGGWLWGENLPGQGSAQYAAAKQFDNYCRQFMDGEPGRIVTQYYWDTFINGNFLLLNQYFHVGYGLGFQMGLMNSQVRSDTPRQAAFRTLGS